jgi:hypothetical protein
MALDLSLVDWAILLRNNMYLLDVNFIAKSVKYSVIIN